MKSKAAVRRIVEELKLLYPDVLCSLQYKKDYELLFAVRLSAQCTDARVNMVTPSLYAKFPTLEAFAAASYEEVGEAIKSCGFYNTKSKDLVECAKLLLEKFGGKVPGTMEELTALPGIGQVLAERIIAYREAHGGFQTVEELMEVDGIGEKKLSELRDRVTVGEENKNPPADSAGEDSAEIRRIYHRTEEKA